MPNVNVCHDTKSSACTLTNPFQLQLPKQHLPAVRLIQGHGEEAESGAEGAVEDTLTTPCLLLTACLRHLAISNCPVLSQQLKLHLHAPL